MENTLEKTDISQRLLGKALGQKPALPLSENTIEKAQSVLKKFGIPEVKNERYKYANIKNILNKTVLETEGISARENYPIADSLSVLNGKNMLVTVNGKVVKQEISEAFHIGTIQDYLAYEPQISFDEADSMQALALLTAQDGFHLKIGRDTTEPLIWLNITDTKTPSYYATVNCIESAAGSAAEIIEIRIGRNAASFTNQYTLVKTHEHATLRMAATDENLHSFSGVFTVHGIQKKGSTFSHSILGTGASFMRQNISAEHEDENCHTELNGFYAVDGERHADFQTVVKHMFPNCTSDEMYKGIAAGKGKAIFNGKVYVARDAQKTNAYQSNKNILLSDEALIRSKPELEIYADDVKCSHGSTTGQTDTKSLFYLRSRGIREKEAQKMLMLAFAGDVLDRISNESLREYFSSVAENKLMQLI
ncbi:MAG: Fe-S cluster assembly protein SufD [Flavobacteriales bacterium]|nr:Fe-S cluster assembly protein SufD [Flavobacteriales bacterium]